jgi:Ankyrin repeats (many copies)
MTQLETSGFGSQARIASTQISRQTKRQYITMCKDSTPEPNDQRSKKTKKSVDMATNIRQTLESRPLPDPKDDIDPTVFLQDLVYAMYGFRPEVKPALKLEGYFPVISEDQIAAYDMKVLTAARDNDLKSLKLLYEAGQTMDCCNRFGESLLHLACRRGFTEVGNFLLMEAKLGVRISDDCGRNPFHDICWNPKVEVELAELILERDPTLLLIGDKRGHTPFDYARPEDWRTWREFLFERRILLNPLQGESAREVFCTTEE